MKPLRGIIYGVIATIIVYTLADLFDIEKYKIDFIAGYISCTAYYYGKYNKFL